MWSLERSGTRIIYCYPFSSHRAVGTAEEWRGEDLHGIHLPQTEVHDHLLLRDIRITHSEFLFLLRMH